MTPQIERRALGRNRRYVWPHWFRWCYLLLTRPAGLRTGRIIVFVIVATAIGGAVYWAVEQTSPSHLDMIERRVNDAEQRAEEKAETIERRLDRVEDAIVPSP